MRTSGPVSPHIDAECLQHATTLRRALHSAPEISNHETGTARTITAFVSDFAPDEVVQGSVAPALPPSITEPRRDRPL